jgi:NADPH-dependent F420 reductase
MRIGILGGTGPAGSALAARLASIGYTAVIGSRSADRASEIAQDFVTKFPQLAGLLSGGDNAAASECDLVVIATPWDSAATTVQENADALAGKVIISMANALVRVAGEFQPLLPPRGSVAAHIQAAVPRSRVVAAFHHLPAKELGHIGEPIDSDVLICSDDPSALREVSEIVDKIPGCRPLDAGQLSNATAIEAFTAVLLQLNVRYKTRVAPKLTGIRSTPEQK